MKKVLSFLVAFALSAVLLQACGSEKLAPDNSTQATQAAEPTSEAADTTAAVTDGEPKFELGEASSRIWKDSINSVWIQFSAPIKNTGDTDLYLSACAADLEDKDGKLVDTFDLVSAYPQIIKPGETGYYYEETTLDGKDVQDYKVVVHPDVKESRCECIRFDVSDAEVKDTDYYGIEVLGRVKNTTSETQSSVYVSVCLFYKDNKLIGHCTDMLTNDLLAGEQVSFKASGLSLPDDVKAKDVASTEIVAYPFQYSF